MRKMSATEARVNFGAVLRAVSERGEHIEVEKGGEPIAVVISIEEYRALRDGKKPPPRVDWYERVLANQALFAGLDLPDPADIIREGRDERDRQMDEALGRR